MQILYQVDQCGSLGVYIQGWFTGVCKRLQPDASGWSGMPTPCQKPTCWGWLCKALPRSTDCTVRLWAVPDAPTLVGGLVWWSFLIWIASGQLALNNEWHNPSGRSSTVVVRVAGVPMLKFACHFCLIRRGYHPLGGYHPLLMAPIAWVWLGVYTYCFWCELVYARAVLPPGDSHNKFLPKQNQLSS